MASNTAAQVTANPAWYHTIELPDGSTTPGHVDWRGYPQRLFPDDLSGLRALDVDSNVERVACDVLELTPERVGGGGLDLAFIGALLLHVRDPIRALENVRATLRPGGRIIMLEAISLPETLRSPRKPVARFDTADNAMNWWLPNARALHDYLWAAGFVEIRRLTRPLRPPSLATMRCWYCAFEGEAP